MSPLLLGCPLGVGLRSFDRLQAAPATAPKERPVHAQSEVLWSAVLMSRVFRG